MSHDPSIQMRATRTIRFTAAALGGLLLLAGCDSPSDGGRRDPARLDIVSGDLQTQTTVGTELPEPLVVRVEDDKGRPVSNQLVNFVVTAGSGSVFAGSAITNRDGEARERWTLGTAAGDTQRVEARAVDASTGAPIVFATFRAVGRADAPAAIAVVGAGAVAGEAGTAVADSLAVVVRDRWGNAVPAAAVVWTVREGGGSVSPGTTATGPDGIARASWTLGPTVNTPQRVEAAAGLTLVASFAGTAGPPATLTAVRVSGDAQTGTVGAALPQPLAVRVTLPDGRPLAGIGVVWGTGTGAVVPASSVTGADGVAQAAWTLGTVAGPMLATATPTGGLPLAFTATAVADAPATLAKAGGDNQAGTAGGLLPAPLRVVVRDRYDNAVPGATVAWSTADGGSLAPAASQTSAAGIAETRWTLGSTGEQTAAAAVAGLPAVTFTAALPAAEPEVVLPPVGTVVGTTAPVAYRCAPGAACGTARAVFRTFLGPSLGYQVQTLATLTPPFDGPVSLAGAIAGGNGSIELGVIYTFGGVERSVYTVVETGLSPAWTEAVSAGEEVLDVSADRVLYRTGVRVGAGDRFFIRSRSGGPETEILAVSDRLVVTARLTPRGAILVLNPYTSTEPHQLYEWRDGALLPTVNVAPRNGAAVDGGWAAWNAPTADQVRVRNLETGAEQAFSPARDPDVAANGDVVFSRPGVGVVRVRGGVEEVLAADGAFPETDGVNVVYAACTRCTSPIEYSIRLHRPEGPLHLWTQGFNQFLGTNAAGSEYVLLDNGWITLRNSSGEARSVGRRAPDGTVVTLSGGTSTLALAPSGAMVWFGTQNYSVLRPDGSTVGNLGTRGTFRFVGDELYVLLGRTAFRVSY